MTAEDRMVMDVVVQRINAIMRVNKVILFGSRARGNPHEDSDFDICVVAEEIIDGKLNALRSIRHSLADMAQYPMDILLYSKPIFDQRSAEHAFEQTIVKEGVKVYG